MADSSQFSSLFALVDSHLSKVSLQDSSGSSNTTSLLNSLRNGSVSEPLLSDTRPRLPIPTLSSNESQIQSVLAQQIANMLKAKEKKQQEEKQRKLEEGSRRLEIDDELTTIDLLKAIQTPYNKPQRKNQEAISNSSSLESLFEKDLNVSEVISKMKTPQPYLPCIKDMSYILKRKVKMGKCSAFGKVLCSRLRPVVAPYLRERIPTDIARFDFSTPSPCDIIKANLRKPTMSSTYTIDITKFV